MLAEGHTADCCTIYLVGGPRRLSALSHKYGDVSASLFVPATATTTCHSERSEESPSTPQSVAEGEIHRFAQDDKIRGLKSKARHGQKTHHRNCDNVYLG